MKPLAIDVLANAIRGNPRTLAAGALAERYLRALHAAGYVVTARPEPQSDPEDDYADRAEWRRR